RSVYRNFRPAALAVLMLVAAGCAQVAPRPSTVLPQLSPLVTTGAEHYTIRAAGSDVDFLVYRAGPLAAFGHNHVIRASEIGGDVYLNRDFALSGFRFTLPVKGFRVDEAAERATEGSDFAVQPSPQAIAGTTHNMLSPALLDAEKYPEIVVRSAAVAGLESAPVVTTRITLRGVQRDVRVPITLTVSGAQLIASGSFEIRQSDFGMTPFSILGGGLQVADTIKVHFLIMAVRE
ncbi:MAG TPA: YceI family protein, partial [Gammaproteobacteria bacterium]